MWRIIFAVAASAAFFVPNARADVISSVSTNATVPLPVGSCLLIDQGGTTDAKLCSNYAAAFGAVPLNGALGTPSSGNAANLTGLPVTGISGLGANIATLLATPSSANLRSALTDETGLGLAVFSQGPTISGLTLGDVTGSTQCLHANASGIVTGTGVDCGVGGSASAAGAAGAIQYSTDGAGTFGGAVITGIVKGTGAGAPTAATAGTDYAPPTSGSAILKGNGSGGFSAAAASTDYAPATAGSAILKGNGAGGFSSATPSTDYAPATSGSAILKGNGSGGFSAAAAGTDYSVATTGTANTPLFNNGSGGFTNGTRSGNTTAVVTKDASSPSANDCVKWDADGNVTTAGIACGGGGSPTVTDGTTSVSASTISFDPVVFDVIDAGSGTAQLKQITTVRTISGTSDTVIASDANKTLRLTNSSATTLAATAAATLGANFGFYLECDGAGGCVFDPSSSETVDGAATVALAQYAKAYISTDGTNWRAAYLTSKDPLNASNLTSGTAAVARGGTGLASGTSGGVLAYTASGTLASSGALTANLPVIGGGAGAVPTVGTRSGNTTTFVTTTGTQTSGKCVTIDGNGNHVADSSACGGAGATPGGADTQVQFNNSTVFAGTPNATITGHALNAPLQFTTPGRITDTLSADQNNYTPTGWTDGVTTIEIDGGAANRTITGLAATVDGHRMRIVNTGTTNDLILANESTSSTAGNRFLAKSDMRLSPGTPIELIYTAGTVNRWKPVTMSVSSGVTFAKDKSLTWNASEDFAQHSLTGTTSLTKLSSCRVPAGSTPAGSVVIVNLLTTRPTSQSGNEVLGIYFGTTDDTAGTLIWNQTMGSTVRIFTPDPIQINFRAANSQFVLPIATNGTLTSAMVTGSYDSAVNDMYFVLAVTPAQSGDTVVGEKISCSVSPPGGK